MRANLRQIKDLPSLWGHTPLTGHERTPDMLRLSLLLYSIVGSTLAGVGVIAVLTLGWYDVPSILTGAVVGAVLGVPASWMVARTLQSA
jgi:hypothetical protein